MNIAVYIIRIISQIKKKQISNKKCPTSNNKIECDGTITFVLVIYVEVITLRVWRLNYDFDLFMLNDRYIIVYMG